MPVMQPRRLLALGHMLLVVAFVAGAVIVATHQRSRDMDVRRAGVIIMVVAAALIFVRLGVGEMVGSLAPR
jgi:glucose uptake protein GlcU